MRRPRGPSLSIVTSTQTAAALLEPARRELAQHIEAFERIGGVIEIIPFGVSAFADTNICRRRRVYRQRAATARKTHRRRKHHA